MTILVVAGLVFLAALGIAREQVTAPGPLDEAAFVKVERGASLGTIAEQLFEAGAIESAMMFRLAARYSGQAGDLKFGEYEIPPAASVEEILEIVTSGRSIQYSVTIPEGMTVAMAVDRLNEMRLLTGEIEEMPAEGSLMPDTYSFSRGDTRQSVIETMQAAMQKELDAAWEARAPDLPLESKEQLLILASIVEKETRPEEHKKVASVFVNRLNKGMKLQTDPTVIYGITLGTAPLGRGLRRSELAAATPYNTYVIEGLPPTPIANPGRESIRAVADPDETPYFYFVADGTGGHAFAETLDEHNRNVANWRKIERERQAAQQ
ncbi:MAG: endolytic transglycosylase MltG [Pseudomonadota bacterium]